jgi:hypothetical protein
VDIIVAALVHPEVAIILLQEAIIHRLGAILHLVAVAITHPAVAITILEEVIMEDILIIEEGMATMGEVTLTTGATHTTEVGIPTVGGIHIMEDGTRTIGDMVPGMAHGIFHPGMLLLHRLSTMHRLLLIILFPHNSNRTLILIQNSWRNMGRPIQRRLPVSGLLCLANM